MYNLNMVIYISEWSVDQQIGIYEKSCKVIYNKILSYDGKIDELKKKIYTLTLLSTIPGFDLNIYKVNNIIFIDFILHINDSDQIPDTTALFQLLKTYEVNNNSALSVESDTLKNFKNYLYITVDHPDDFHNLRLSKDSLTNDFDILSENSIHHEKGAGSVFVAFLLGIASSASWDFLKSKIKESGYYYEYLNSDEIDINLIATKISELAKTNVQDLNLVSFNQLNEYYQIYFKTRYKSISVKVNKMNQIIKLDIADNPYLSNN